MGTMKERIEALRAIPLFETVDEAVLAEIAGILIERKFPRGAVIFEEGSEGEYMYLIREGQVKVTKTSEDGREKILDIFNPGGFFGEMALLERKPRSASVKTLRPSVLLALSRRDFLGLIRENPDLAMELIRELSARLRETDEQIRSLLFERVEGRARRLLRKMARNAIPGRPDFRSTPPITHQQLADWVGTSRETITRVVKDLKDEGWLEQDGKHYIVPISD
jgi:CRP-like cAMP-binding protein